MRSTGSLGTAPRRVPPAYRSACAAAHLFEPIQPAALPRRMQDAPLLHATSLLEAFGGFASSADRDAFRRRISGIPGFWCCRAVAQGQDGGQGYAKPMLEGM